MLSDLKYKDGGHLQEGFGLLTSILMRYPEVGSVHYWRGQHALKFTFLVTQAHEVTHLQELLKPALELFHQFEGQRMKICDIACRCDEDVCVITITRDVDSITQREVGLIVELLKVKYQHQLVYDEMCLPEDEKIYQEEMIIQLLNSIQSKDINKNVVALREEGKVLVFKN